MVNIMDHENREVVERFPLHLVREPTAFTSTDPKVRVSPDVHEKKGESQPRYPRIPRLESALISIDSITRVTDSTVRDSLKGFTSTHRSQGESLPRHIHGCHTKMRVNLDIYGFQDQSHRFQGERQTKGVHIHRS